VGWRGGRRRSRPVLAAFFCLDFLGLDLFLFVLLFLLLLLLEVVLLSAVGEATAEDAELELRAVVDRLVFLLRLAM